MKRRVFLKQAGVGASLVVCGSLLATGVAHAQNNAITDAAKAMADNSTPAITEPIVEIAAEIAANHGHVVNMSLVDFVDAIRQTASGKSHQMSIKGQSGHDHQLVLEHLELIDLLVKGTTIKKSEVGAGHQHQVTLMMEITS